MAKKEKAPKQTEAVKQPPRKAKAIVRYLRISPRKMRLVIDTIRRRSAHDASAILATLNKKAAKMVGKALKSALANAKGLGLEENRLYISDIRADGGPIFKRFMTRSMGRADRILKRTTQLKLELTEAEKSLLGKEDEVAQATKTKKKKIAKAR